MRTVPGSRCNGMAGSPARPIVRQAQLTKLCRLSKFLTVAKPVAKPQLRIGRARALTIDDAVRAMLPPSVDVSRGGRALEGRLV
jgi:hypothetical protein